MPAPQPFPDLEAEYDALYGYCWHRLGNPQQAEDATQEAFLRTFAAAQSNPALGQHSAARRYLYTVARNLCTDVWRAAKRAPQPLPEQQNDQPVQPGFEPRLTQTLALRAAVQTLPSLQKDLVLLCYGSALPLGTAARVLGVSRFRAYRQLNKALAALRAQLQEER